MFQKLPKMSVYFLNFTDAGIFLQWWSIFPKIKVFQNFCSNLIEKLFFRVYNDKSNVIQVLESNYVHIHKKDWFFKNHFWFNSNTV